MLLTLVIAALAATWTGPDEGTDRAAEAVAKLVSPRAAERSAAEQAIAALGDAALPALNEAMESSNLELRHRAAALLDAREGARLVRPTMVTLNFDARTVGDIAAAIGREAGVSLLIEPEDGPRVRERPITLRAPGPVPLWDAIDRLGRAAALRLDANTAPWA